jgi:hypothetical protein
MGDVEEISTENESDGESALRKVKEQAAHGSEPVRRRPKSNTRKHWHEPVKVVEPGKKPKRWQFKCKYCTVYIFSFPCQNLK